MNILLDSIAWALFAVATACALAGLVAALWKFARPPAPPAPRPPLPQDRTTAAAAKMFGAARDIEQRLYEADAIGCLLDDDELVQLCHARVRIVNALRKLNEYEEREQTGIVSAECGQPNDSVDPIWLTSAAPQHSKTPSLQHSATKES